jgi:uncharacterized lipoprotein YmbA
MMINRPIRCVAPLACALILAGCASSPIEHFYTVSNAEVRPGQMPSSGTISGGRLIAVLPVTVPALIDRPQLVVRTSAHEVGILENHRWAEPLAVDLTRALIASLQHNGAGLDFESAEATQAKKAEQVLEVDITELLSGPGPVTSLQASWVLHDRSRTAVRQGDFAKKIPTQTGYQAIADGYADAIAQLAEAIARQVRSEPDRPN